MGLIKFDQKKSKASYFLLVFFFFLSNSYSNTELYLQYECIPTIVDDILHQKYLEI